MTGFLAAVAFLTRIPIASSRGFDAGETARAMRWFPLVGALIGGAMAGGAYLLSPLFPPLVVAGLVVAFEAAVTGGLHIDGLADTFDGLGGGRTREDGLRIMRDHAVGAYGATAIVLVLVIQVAAITALVESRSGLLMLVLAPALGRWTSVLLSFALPYARRTSAEGRAEGGPVSEATRASDVVLASLLALGLAVGLAGAAGAAALAVAVVVAGATGAWFRRRIGGVTGDTLGATIEITQTAVLLTAL